MGGFGSRTAKDIKKEKSKNAPLSAVPNSRNSKTKIFFSFLKKSGARKIQKKCRENFSVLGLKFLQNFRAESGAEVQKSEFGFSSKKVRISFKSPNQLSFLGFSAVLAAALCAAAFRKARIFQAFLKSKKRVRSEI